MKVGIISDSHDNEANLKRVIGLLNGKVEALIHCGDFCAPYIIGYMADLGVPVHCCFGNTDDRFTTTRICDAADNVTLYGDIGVFEIDGRKIAINHYPMIADGLAHTGKYDAVFYGHTHKQKESKIGDTLLVNPGEIVGRKGEPCYAIYDSEKNKVKFFTI